MATIIDLPRRAFDTTRSLAMAPVRPLIPAGMVDEWGRDEHVIRALSPLLRLRWNASVGGENRLPTRAGALLVTNDRRLSFSPLYVSWALAEATGRPVRFVGHPDIVPFGPAMRRLGAILRNPSEVRGALHHGELVVLVAATRTWLLMAGPLYGCAADGLAADRWADVWPDRLDDHHPQRCEQLPKGARQRGVSWMGSAAKGATPHPPPRPLLPLPCTPVAVVAPWACPPRRLRPPGVARPSKPTPLLAGLLGPT